MTIRWYALASTVLVLPVLLGVGTVLADTHAPWPTDWNDWSDPALWATVGNPGNGSPGIRTDLG